MQQLPVSDTSFHGPVEGHVDSPIRPNYGPDAPFWGTSMGQSIVSFGVHKPSPEHPSYSEEEYRKIQSAILICTRFSRENAKTRFYLSNPNPS